METEEGARACLVENSTLFEGKHLRVDLAAKDHKNDTKKSIFIGNLPFNISEEKVWDFFGTCGQVTNVRLVRDRKTNLGKGFGYVTFAEKSSIELALQLAGSECAGREIRISKCTKEGYHKETQLHKLKRNAQNNPENLEKSKEKIAIKPAAGFAKKCASVAPVYRAKPSKKKKKSGKHLKATKSS
jgi:nucleolar protein 12